MAKIKRAEIERILNMGYQGSAAGRFGSSQNMFNNRGKWLGRSTTGARVQARFAAVVEPAMAPYPTTPKLLRRGWRSAAPCRRPRNGYRGPGSAAQSRACRETGA